MDKDLKRIFKALENQGFELRRRKSGHMGVFKDGAHVADFGGTNSDYRGVKNSLAKCKRAGFQWPP